MGGAHAWLHNLRSYVIDFRIGRAGATEAASESTRRSTPRFIPEPGVRLLQLPGMNTYGHQC